MKKVLLSLAAALIMVAGFATNADAQRGRGGPGFYRGGGGGFVGVRGGGFRVAGPGFRRAGRALCRRSRIPPRRLCRRPRRWGGRRWVGGPRWWGPRRFVGAGFVGAGLVGAGATTPATAAAAGSGRWSAPLGAAVAARQCLLCPGGLWLRLCARRLLRRRRLVSVTLAATHSTRRALPGGFFKSISRRDRRRSTDRPSAP